MLNIKEIIQAMEQDVIEIKALLNTPAGYSKYVISFPSATGKPTFLKVINPDAGTYNRSAQAHETPRYSIAAATRKARLLEGAVAMSLVDALVGELDTTTSALEALKTCPLAQ